MGFALEETLRSGQIFRWRLTTEGAWICHRDRLFHLSRDGTSDAEQEWLAHFLREDQPALNHPHPYVQEALAHNDGLRILRQDPWECLVTFIISQNNHQARIQKNCLAISEAFGEPLGEGFHAFPTPSALGSEEELRSLGLGYRAHYLAALRELDLAWLESLRDRPYPEAKEALCTLPGVGPKVADCILLFSLGFEEACPEDVWIKRVFGEHGLTREALGPKAGLLQQFLFHHARG